MEPFDLHDPEQDPMAAAEGKTPMSWLHAHFSRDLAIHAIFDFDPLVAPDAASALRLTHGYVLERRAVLGVHEWRCDGRTGLGEALDFLGMSQITALYNGTAETSDTVGTH